MKTKKIILTIISSIFSLLSYSQVQTQNLNMGLYQLQFPSANGGNNRIQSYGGTFPGKWELKSRFDHIYIDAGENASNQFDLIFLNGGLEGARLKSNGYFGIGTSNPRKKLEVNGDILLENYTGIKQIFTWRPDDSNWRIGMNENPGFNRSMLTGHVQYLTYGQGLTQGFSVGVNGGDSSLEIRGTDHTAFFRGNVGVGTTDTKGFKLGVQGKVAAEEVKVAMYNNWPDFVFENSYKLPTLKEVEQHIIEKGYLKDIPSAEDVKENGIFLGKMNAKLLQKIEELTLYAIQQEKELQNQKLINRNLENRLQKIESLLSSKK